MRIARVEHQGEIVLAMPMGDRWVDVSHAWQDYERIIEGVDAHSIRDMREFIERGFCTHAVYQRLFSFIEEHGASGQYDIGEDPLFLQPLRPGKIIAIGRNYAAHVREFDNDMPEEPLFFVKVADTCIGPNEPIRIKDWYGRVDHEGEVGVVIGHEIRDARPELAQAFIAGYTLLNDVTAREIQKADAAQGKPWFRAKNMDTFCPLGPTVLLREEAPWPITFDIEVKVNGETRQKSNTQMFLFGLPEIIAYVSKHITLYPGDIIATGTPEGVGRLTPGDTVEVIVPEIGILRNPVE